MVVMQEFDVENALCFFFIVYLFAIGIEPASFCPALDILHGIRKNEGRSSEVAIAIAACA